MSGVWVRVCTPLFRVAFFPKYGKVPRLRLNHIMATSRALILSSSAASAKIYSSFS